MENIFQGMHSDPTVMRDELPTRACTDVLNVFLFLTLSSEQGK